MASTNYIVQIIGKDKTGKAFKQVQGNADKARQSVINLKNVILALGAGAAIRSIIRTTARFEDLRTSLASVTGSAEAGAEAFGFISKFATKTQFGVDDLTETFIKLKSAGITPTESLLTTFTDTAAITTDQLGSLTAITDLFARSVSGGLGLEDLNRLADRGAPVFKILEEQLGLTRLEVSKFGQSAEGAEEIRQALIKGLNESFGGATAQRVNNLSTQMSNFGIAMTNAQDILGQGLAPAFGDITVRLTDFINNNEELIKSVGVNLGTALNDAIDLFNLARKNIEETSLVIIALVSAFNPVAGVILIALTAVNQFRNGLERTLGVPVRLADVFKGTFEFIKATVRSSLDNLIEGLKEFVNNAVRLINFLPFTDVALPFEIAEEQINESIKSLDDFILAQIRTREEAEKTALFYKQLEDQLSSSGSLGAGQDQQSEQIALKFGKDIQALQDKFRTEEEIIMDNMNKQLSVLKDFLEQEGTITREQFDIIKDLKLKITEETNQKLKELDDQRLKDMTENYDKQLQLIKDFKFQELELENLTGDQRKKLVIDSGRELINQMSTQNRKAFEIAKALDTAEAIMSTAKGVAKAIGSGNFILAGIIGALGAVQVAKIQSQQYQGRALGGSVQQGKNFLVGEQGPEMFVPNQSGTIVANKDLGRSTNVNITIMANDTEGFDNLLLKRRSTIVNVINDALNTQGKEALV